MCKTPNQTLFLVQEEWEVLYSRQLMSLACPGNKSAPASLVAPRTYRFFARFFLLFCFAQHAGAEDYFWGDYYDGPRFSSPQLYCRDLVDRQNKNNSQSNYYTRLDGVTIGLDPTGWPDDRYATCIKNNYRISDNEWAGGTRPMIYRWGNSCPEGTTYNRVMGHCRNDQKKGPPPLLACVGNPINVSNGNKYQTEADYLSSSTSTLSFTRSYNSFSGLWQHNYSTYIQKSGANVALVMADGREYYFSVNGTTVSASPTASGRLVIIDSNTWVYTSESNERYTFDVYGRLIRWANSFGAEHLLTYTNNRVTVTDNFGQSLSFTEDARRQPLTFSSAGLAIKYDYNTNERLIKLTRTRGGQTEQRQFHYEDPAYPDLLTGITDERGVRYATWSYDDQGRAISSEHAGGADKILIAYNADGSSTVTNELGKKATYRFQTIQGVRRITAIEGEPSANCPNSNSTFTYDDRGLLKTKTDNKGHLTTYDYNDRGLEISRTEAADTPQARTITTDWHPTLFLPVTVTEPAQITHYTYNDQGRQLSLTVTPR